MKILNILCAILIWAGAASAAPFNVQDLRNAVQDRNFEAVDLGLAQAQTEFLAGERSAQDMRDLYIAVSRSAPDMVSFVAEWVSRDPDNHRAQISRAWSLYNGANFIRRAGNHYAYRVSDQMYDELRAYATAAYETNPDLIPAADAMVRDLGTRSFSTPSPDTVMDETLTKYPNYGTILRYVPNMGHYTAAVIKRFCNAAAVDFDEADRPMIEHKCLLESAVEFGLKDLRDYGRETLWTKTYPEVELNRVAFFIYGTDFREWSDAQIEWATNVLLTHPMDQFQAVYYFRAAQRLKDILASSHGRMTLITENYKRIRYPDVSEALKHDPYNLGLIELASHVEFLTPSILTTTDDGHQRITSGRSNLTEAERTALDAGGKAQRLDFAARRLLASPYHSGYWAKYAGEIARSDHPTTMFAGDKARVNSIVFSNDPARSLQGMVGDKTSQYKSLMELQAMSDEQQELLPNWKQVLDSTSIARDVLCPALRAKLLHEAVCARYEPDAQQCQPTQGMWRDHELKMISDAKSAPECSGLLATKEPSDLWYEPIDFHEAMGTLGSH